MKKEKEKVFWMDVPAVEPPEYYYRFWDSKSGCHLDKLRVHRRTLAGAFLCVAKPNGLQAFVLNVGKKKFAYPTIEEAKISFLARKRWQLSYLKTTIDRVEEAVRAMNEGSLELYPPMVPEHRWHIGAGEMILPEDKDKISFGAGLDFHDI